MIVDLDPTALAALLEKAADFSMVIDADGQIVELALSNDELTGYLDENWVGKSWVDTVTHESRGRIAELLQQAVAERGAAVRSDINHQLDDGTELPVQYRAVCPNDDNRVLALGRDMRPATNLRQQLLNAQQALEQDYWRLRQIETRYRRLFEMVADAVVVVDEATGRVLEANPAATEMLAVGDQRIIGRPFPVGFDPDASKALAALLNEARSVGKASVNGVALAEGQGTANVSASFLRQGAETRYLVRMASTSGDTGEVIGGEYYLPEAIRRAPDAVLLVDDEGRIQAANKAFLDLAQLVSEEQALGYTADRWLGRSGVDVNVLLTNLRQLESVKLFSTVLRGDLGTTADVEISASRVGESDKPGYAFFIRDVGRRVAVEHPMTSRLPRSIEQVTKQVGRVPLKELVRESTDIIEALCIEAALELTHDNRASAAELLGLSRQSLYAKLRRYNIGATEVVEDA